MDNVDRLSDGALYPYYKPFRNHMRKFAAIPTLEQLWTYYRNSLDGVPLPSEFARWLPRHADDRYKLYAWDIEILVREAILNAGKIGREDFYKWPNVATAVNHIRRLEGAPYKEANHPDILIELQRIAHRQFRWQSGNTTAAQIIRALKVFGAEALDEKVLAATGLSMRHVIRLGFAVAGGFTRDPWLSLAKDYSGIGVPITLSKPLLERVTCNLAELRTQTQACQDYDDAWLYSQFPLEYRPLIRVNSSYPDHVLCPIPRYFLSRLTSGIFFDIANIADFSNSYGASFETYVGEVLNKTLPPPSFRILEQRPYSAGKGYKKHGADWIVMDESSHLFIECKTKRLSVNAKNVTNLETVDKDLTSLAQAIVQNYKNILDARKGITTWPQDDLPIFPLIVTLEDWYLFSSRFTSKILDTVRDLLEGSAIDPGIVDEMPYTVISSAELERAMQVVATRGISTVFSQKGDLEFRNWGMIGFLQHHFSSELKGSRALLFAEDAQRLFPEFDVSRL